jgi:hypothetical protein
LNRSRFLIIHGITTKSWCARHDLEPYTRPCSRCGAGLTTTIPFAVGQMRGLMAPVCSCGNENTPYCVVRDARFGDLMGGPLG